MVSEPSALESLVLMPAVSKSHPLANVSVDTPSPILYDVFEASSVLSSMAEYAI